MSRWSGYLQSLGGYALAAVLTLLLVVKLQFLYRGDVHVPLSYSGDSILFESWCKAVVEQGWHLHNPSLGAPYGQTLYDFPQADALNFAFFKAFGLFSRDSQLAIHLFSLATYVATTLAALCVLRCFGIGYPPALASAILYSLLPYHFARLDCGHHLLACYYVVPFSVLLAMWLYLGRLGGDRNGNAECGMLNAELLARPGVLWGLALLISAAQGAAGVYYAFFGVYFVAIGGLAAAFERRSWRPVWAGALCVLVTLVSVGANVAPSLLYWRAHGTNPSVAARPVTDSELYGLRLTATLLPVIEHRIKPLDRLRQRYEEETFAYNESASSAQGLVANIGLIVLLGLLLYRRPVSDVLAGLSILNVFGILLGTVGGLGALFSLLVAAQIRSQNRISVFLSFYSLACVAVLLAAAWQRLATTRWRQHLPNGLLILLVLAALWDQHSPRCRHDFAGVKRRWSQDAEFVAAIEKTVPAAAMIFQLPYISYPESPPVGRLESYSNLRFYLHSSTLRWSGGAMRGRESDAWQQHVLTLPPAEQLAALAAAGFAGIQVSRLGYDDLGQQVEAQLRQQLGVEPLVSPSGDEAFFPFDKDVTARLASPKPQRGALR